MHILFINQLIVTETLKAICWTLVHSVWQGLLLAVAGGVVVLLTKKRHPSFRYNLLSILFISFVITSAYTFVAQLSQANSKLTSLTADMPVNTNLPDATSSSNISYTFNPLLKNFSEGFTYYFDKHAPLVVMAWFIILSARIVKMLSGLTYINRIRNQHVHSPSEFWKSRLQQLKLSLRINKSIQLLESGIIKVPVAVGWLKPIILIPAGLFTHLSEDQLEAILLHELAHIKRKDYFFNLLQSVAETLFFFNPAVLWISSLIREERENCCDDMAIGITNNKTKFISALVSFQEYNITNYAMPFPGRKNQLLNRVQRIIYNNNNTLNSFEKAGLVSCSLAIILLSAFIIPEHGKHPLLNKILNITGTADGSGFLTEQKIEAAESIDLEDEKRDAFNKDNALLKKPERIVKKDVLRSSVIKPVKYSEYYKPSIEKKDTAPIKKIEINLNNIKLNTHSNLEFKSSFNLNVILKQIDTLINLNRLEVKLAPIEINTSGFNTNFEYKFDYDSSYLKQPYKPDSSIKIKNYNLKPRPKPQPRPKAAPDQKPLADPVIAELIKQKIIQEAVIKNKENLYNSLNNEELMVQSIRQAETLYQKLRAKYLSPAGRTTRSYTWKN